MWFYSPDWYDNGVCRYPKFSELDRQFEQNKTKSNRADQAGQQEEDRNRAGNTMIFTCEVRTVKESVSANRCRITYGGKAGLCITTCGTWKLRACRTSGRSMVIFI